MKGEEGVWKGAVNGGEEHTYKYGGALLQSDRINHLPVSAFDRDTERNHAILLGFADGVRSRGEDTKDFSDDVIEIFE